MFIFIALFAGGPVVQPLWVYQVGFELSVVEQYLDWSSLVGLQVELACAFLCIFGIGRLNIVSWMDAVFLSNSKVSECKSGPYEHAQSMSKCP